jgi:hypothetical protein
MKRLTFVGLWALAASTGQLLKSTRGLSSTHTLLSLTFQNIKSKLSLVFDNTGIPTEDEHLQ